MKPDRLKVFSTAAVLLALACLLLPGVSQAAPRVEKMVLANGLVLLVIEEHTLPVVTFQALVDAGSWRDPEDREGLANLTARGLLLGTASLPIDEMYRQLDFIGSSLEASCQKDYVTLTLKSLKKDVDAAFRLFLDALVHPAFPESEVRREVGSILGTIQFDEGQPELLALRTFDRALYLKGPYGHPVEGTKESLGRIEPGTVREFHDSHYRPNATILAVVGDVTAGEVKEKFAPLLEAWPSKAVPSRPFESETARTANTVKINRAITQANIVLGHGGIARSSEDYYAVSVMNQILGRGGLTSRMAEEIRVKRGLAYAVESAFTPRRHPGAFKVVIMTKNASAREAIDLAIQQMERIRNEPVSREELDTAKKFLVGNFPLRFDAQEEIASLYNQMQYYGLGLDYPERYPSLIRSITAADVLRVARAYLHPDECIVVVVGDLEAAGMK